MKNKIWIWIIVIVALFGAYHYNPDLFSITTSAESIQYTNVPFQATLISINETILNVTASLDNFIIDDYNLTQVDSNTVLFDWQNPREGILKIYAQGSSTLRFEFKQPYVVVKHNIPTNGDVNQEIDIVVNTFDPQGKVLNSTKVSVLYTTPISDNEQTLELIKENGNTFTGKFQFVEPGNYFFTVVAESPEYTVKREKTLTTVLSTSGAPMVLIVNGIVLGIWLIFYIRKKIKK